MAEFSSDEQTRKVSGLVDELIEHVLYDEEPLFVSNEATLWGVSIDPHVRGFTVPHWFVEVARTNEA